MNITNILPAVGQNSYFGVLSSVLFKEIHYPLPRMAVALFVMDIFFRCMYLPKELYSAIEAQNLGKIQSILNLGGIIEATHLHRACERNYPHVVQFLLERGAKVDLQAFYIALNQGFYEIAQVLLDKASREMLGFEENKESLFHVACQVGSESFVKEFISRGVNINVKDSGGATPLHDACFGGQCEIVKILLDQGAEKDARDADDRTPLEYAILGKRREVVAFLLQDEEIDRKDALRTACLVEELEFVILLLETKMILEEDTISEPLIDAIQKKNKAMVQLLLEKFLEEGDVNEKIKGDTLLGYACAHGSLEIVELIIEKGANPIDDFGLSLRDLAFEKGDEAMSQFLKDQGIKYKKYISPLQRMLFRITSIRSKVSQAVTSRVDALRAYIPQVSFHF